MRSPLPVATAVPPKSMSPSLARHTGLILSVKVTGCSSWMAATSLFWREEEDEVVVEVVVVVEQGEKDVVVGVVVVMEEIF